MNEGHLDHAKVVLGSFLKTCEDATAFLQPTDQAFNNVTLAISFFVELYRTSITVFVVLAWYHRLDAKLQEIVINPVGPVAFVACKLGRVDDGHIVLIDDVYPFQQGRQGLVVMRLAGRQVHVQRMAMTVAEDVDFRGKTTTGAA